MSLDVADDGPMVVATLRLRRVPTDRVLAAFTDPDVLPRWWGGELSTTLVPGTPYTVSFGRQNRAITGEVVAYRPASHLEFTWAWDHAPGTIRRTVLVAVAPLPLPADTFLLITHGPHADAGQHPDQAESAARAEHREGWEFFLPRLAALFSA